MDVNEIKYELGKKITVTYSASANIDNYAGDRENIHLSVEIDSFDDYENTLELLRQKVLEKIDLNKKFEEIQNKYENACHKFERITKQIAQAQKDWDTARNFLIAQGIKKSSDVAEFPQEALTNLTKSLPTATSGYPE